MITIATGKYEKWITDDGLTRIKGWCRDGLTDDQLAGKIGINRATLYNWRKKYPEITKAIDEGKAPADTKVEDSLYNLANGYYVTVREPIKLRKREPSPTGKGFIEQEVIEYCDRQIYIEPQATAQIFWLKNRKPDKWRDKPKDVENISDDPLNELLRRLDSEAREDTGTTTKPETA